MSSERPLNGIAEVNGAQLYYDIRGEGEPIILIPGFTLDTRMWEPQMKALSPNYQVVRYDLRGSGKSAPPTTAPYARYDDLKALMDYLQFEQAHILGLSVGGAIAVDFVLAYPERALSLIPVDVSALGGYEWPDQLSSWFAPVYKAGEQGDVKAAKKLWLSMGWFDEARKRPAVLAQLEAMMYDYTGWHFQHKDPATTLDPLALGRLGEIQVPTLVIVGEFDLPFYNIPIADVLVRQIPNAQLMVIQGAGHMSNMEGAEQFNEAVLTFLAGAALSGYTE
jgi:3-oxoadipate enol-lactonase